MSNAQYKVPCPHNESVLDYMPGSPEKKLLLKEINKLRDQPEKIPLVINGEHVCKKRLMKSSSHIRKILSLV